ncbi:hypothetical protein MKW94_029312 [Papaver nudicaule]|uniref:Zinc-ribbon 15 domain-containing protein n=1 Tax=Papaver nudicaule TaxID=74823 RepID=A0AA41SN88_PAPNU|nr:hypothetical protein [Papaver nudicaule]
MCGSRADLVDYDKVLKLFFVPVWRQPGKEPLMHCTNCSLFFPPLHSQEPPLLHFLMSCAVILVLVLLILSSVSAPSVVPLSNSLVTLDM